MQKIHKKSDSSHEKSKTFIKIDYIKHESKKSCDDVSRVLDFSNGTDNDPPKKSIKVEKLDDAKPPKSSNDEKLSKLSIKNEVINTPHKSDIKVEKESESKSSSKHSSSKTSHSDHSNRHHHHKSHSSSSHHKKKSSRSSRDCSRCYRRSKIKKSNTGVQARLDYEMPVKQPTRKLEFEPSHRIGVNRHPVTIDTNLSYLKVKFYHFCGIICL